MPTAVSTTTSLSTREVPKKRKIAEEDASQSHPKKRAKRGTHAQKSTEFDNSKGDDGSRLTNREKKEGRKREKQIQHESENEVDSESENSDLENAYAIKSAVASNISVSDEEEHPVHETMAKSTKQRVKTTKRKHVPEDETPEMRDRRTIFVGNLPVEVLSKTVCIASTKVFHFNKYYCSSAPQEAATKTYHFLGTDC